ncbi:MAG: transporter ATP-binding protein [Glaciihabitans sp.]|nr:transporter ATP-binding protein [Glaciihabitans sp.]
MRISLDSVSKGAALPLISLDFETGKVTVAGVETAQRPTVLGLVASGRMAVDTGAVLIDGRQDGKALRAAIALVDAPTVSEPNESVTLAGVVAEELMFAGKPGNPWAVTRALADLGADQYTRVAMADIPPAIRFRVLVELALMRPGITGVVLTSPDRHGGAPAEWTTLAHEVADRGFAVLVIVGQASARTSSSTENVFMPVDAAPPVEPRPAPVTVPQSATIQESATLPESDGSTGPTDLSELTALLNADSPAEGAPAETSPSREPAPTPTPPPVLSPTPTPVPLPEKKMP